jgi:uncharacterized protein YheU (UPF0270 family)
MTTAPEIRAAVGKNIQREREQAMYGCTEAELRESVESSITFRFTGPAMVVASMLSDCQEIMAHGPYDSDTLSNIQEEQRQLLNRAKWILFEYLSPKD